MSATDLPAPDGEMDDDHLVGAIAGMIADKIGDLLHNRADEDTPELSDFSRVTDPAGLIRGARFMFADGRTAHVTVLIEAAEAVVR